MLHKILDPWLRVTIVASLSWPLSYLAASALPLGDSDSSVPIILLTGLLAGVTAALIGWIPIQDQVHQFSRWASANLVGTSIALLVLMATYSLEPNRLSLLLGGACAGLVAGWIQSLALKEQRSRLGPVLMGMLGWAAALAGGSLLMNPATGLALAMEAGQLVPTLLLGWVIVGVLLILVMIGLSPLPRPGYPRGRVRWWP